VDTRYCQKGQCVANRLRLAQEDAWWNHGAADRWLRAKRRTWGAESSHELTCLREELKFVTHLVNRQARVEAQRACLPAQLKELKLQVLELTLEARELRRALEERTVEAADWEARYKKEWEGYKEVAAAKKDAAFQGRKAAKASAAAASAAALVLAQTATAAKAQAVQKAKAAGKQRLLDERSRLHAEAEAAASEASRSMSLLIDKCNRASVRADQALSCLSQARKDFPAGPKEFTADELEEMTAVHFRQVRSREMRFFKAVLMSRSWCIANVATVLHDLGWVDSLMEEKEFCTYLGDHTRNILARCEGVHWGVNFGLWMHLEEKLPSRRVRRIRAAGSEKYDPETDRFKRKELWVNRHNQKDFIYVPYTVPAPCSYADEVTDYSSMFGLTGSEDGSCAIQSVELLVPHVITRDHHRQGHSLEHFEANGFEIILQGDGARRGIKAFCQWVFKNQYIDSESAALVHLICLALGLKDDATGAMTAWGDQLAVIQSIDGRVWDILDPLGSDRVYKIRTTLGMTLDLHAERIFFGIMAGGCLCQGWELQHGVPINHRAILTTTPLVLEWVSRCVEPLMFEHNALAHQAQPGEDIPGPCSQCPLYNGTLDQRRAANDVELAKYRQMVADAEKSLEAKTLFDDCCLDHAHRHRNVRWRLRGIPPVQVPKKNVYLELLHSIPLNACKLQTKHAFLKFLPCQIRAEAGNMFKKWGVPIDTAKPDKRTQEKWPGGGTVQYLVDGGNGKSPGFAVVGAELTFLLAEHLLSEKKKKEADTEVAQAALHAAEARAVQSATAKTATKAKALGASVFAKPGSKAKGVASLSLTGAAGGAKPPTSSKPPTAAAPKKPPEEKRMAYETIPLESQAARTSAEQCAAIKARYGPYLGQRVISTLLSFDTFRTAWKVAYRRLPLAATQEEKNAHAFEWFHEWADWVEAIERCANHNFRRWVPHRLLHQGTRQIAEFGDLWRKSTSALEANQAEMGRTLDQVSSRRRSVDQGDERTHTVVICKPCATAVAPSTTKVVDAKVESSMAMTAAKHFTAAAAFRGDEENRILQRGTQRLVLGAEGRSTAPRTNPKYDKLPVDRDATSVSLLVSKIGKLPA
jgi:hypothetical protein